MIPKVTVGILTYNHALFITECILSLEKLEYENLEIIISDDCSRDNTAEIIAQTIPKISIANNVIFNRNENNLGIAGNINKVFYELASGDFFITLGGDDYFSEAYITESLKLFVDDPDLQMIDYNGYIVKNDLIYPPLDPIFEKKLFTISDHLAYDKISSFAPGRIFRRNLMDDFLPLATSCPTEDTVLVNRALLVGKLLRINKPVVFYRKHENNLSSKAGLQKMNHLQITIQYLKDNISQFEKGKISDRVFLKLLNRNLYDYFRRKVQSSDLNRYLRLLIIKLLKFRYKTLS